MDETAPLAALSLGRCESGWPSLFWDAFTHSASGMALVDGRRRIVAVNDAQLALSGHRREQVLLRPFVDFVRDGRRMTLERWQALIRRGELIGRADLLHANGGVVHVRYIARAQGVLDRVLVIDMPARDADRGAGTGARALSARQLQILRLLALGHTGPEIAARLQLSHHTVRAHIANAKARLGARSHAQLVAAALCAHDDGRPPADSRPPTWVSI